MHKCIAEMIDLGFATDKKRAAKKRLKWFGVKLKQLAEYC